MGADKRPVDRKTLREQVLAAFTRSLDAFLAQHAAPDLDLPGLPPRPSATEHASVTARDRARLLQAREQVYNDGWTRAQVVRRLGVHANSVTDWLAAQRLVALDGPDGDRFPAWQFDPNRPVLLAGVDDVVAVWPGGVVSLSLWMTHANPALEGRTPVEVLHDGDTDLVVTLLIHQRGP